MVEQIKKLCSDNKTSIKALEKELGFGNGTIRRWDTNAPSVDKIIMVANRFNVPVSLITGTDEQKEKSPAPEGAELDANRIKSMLGDMTAEDLSELIADAAAELARRNAQQ